MENQYPPPHTKTERITLSQDTLPRPFHAGLWRPSCVAVPEGPYRASSGTNTPKPHKLARRAGARRNFRIGRGISWRVQARLSKGVWAATDGDVGTNEPALEMLLFEAVAALGLPS